MDSNVNKVKEHCIGLLKNSRCKILPFHGINHTLEVFENVILIGGYENVTSEELELLKIAALFHDTGMSKTYIGHERISANNANIFLRELNYSIERIDKVVKCIKATKMPQIPKTLLARIICDADLFHLSSNNYIIKNELLRVEWKTFMDLSFTDPEWYLLNLEFLTDHKYRTEFGKSVLEKAKNKNIELMKELFINNTDPR